MICIQHILVSFWILSFFITVLCFYACFLTEFDDLSMFMTFFSHITLTVNNLQFRKTLFCSYFLYKIKIFTYFIKKPIFQKIINKSIMQAQKSYEQKAAQEQKKQQVEDYRQGILSQILSPEAKDRLIKIKLVKPQKAAGIENALIQAAQSGMLKNRVSESQLINMLQKDIENQKDTKKITFKRRGIDDEW